jgi:cytochrome c553
MRDDKFTSRRRLGETPGAAIAVTLSVLAGVAVLAAAQQPADTLVELAWAYAIPTEPRPPIVDDGGKHSLPDTPLTFTRDEIRGRAAGDDSIRTAPADWYPGDHPAMPEIVARGDQSRNVIACALCHYPNGKGRPENANPAGLPKAYFIQQMQDFQNDVRQGSEPRKNNYTTMINIAKGMTAEEIEQSADYFSSMVWTAWIDVRETDTVPKTQIIGGMHITLEDQQAGTEPIGNRIVESPIDAHRTELLRDPRSGFIAYVPVGSVAKGENLVRTGGDGKTVQCGICHGEDLDGLGSIPGLAARSPSYMTRQLNDMKLGNRNGPQAELMESVVANLTSEDILNITAYTASLPASGGAALAQVTR